MAAPNAENEGDGSHEDHGADDPAGTTATLALGVETRTPEDEDHHEPEEREPVGLGPPDRPPQDVLAVRHCPQDERRVDPEDQPGEIEDDQGGDAGGPPEQRPDRAAEDLRLPGADVSEGRR